MAETGMELRLERIRRGVRQADVSNATGIPQCVISRIETGKVEDNKRAAELLRKYYGGSEADD